ncbi:MAG: SUF system NifU family Fe-S cluster assembly protein [Actinobacteria bacterium]|nr:SUF system NifU family Fe-S cluster assembly protein [Actinomycetota bacterium]
MELDSLYQQVILDHYRTPSNKGLSAFKDIQVHHNNPSCGDEVTLNLTMKDGVVKEITWDGVGCSISMASASVMSELLLGKNYQDSMKILDAFVELMQSKGKSSGDEQLLEDGVAFAGVSKFPARIKCALLGWMAFKDAATQVMA